MSSVRREARCGIPAGSRRNYGGVPGLSVYLARKLKGDKSRLSKRCLSESVVGQGMRTTRSLCVKLNCLNLNPDRVNVRTHR